MSGQTYFERCEATARACPTIGPALSADWQAISTGGDCMAWSMATFDGCAAIWICDGDNGLGDAGSEFWLIGLQPHGYWLNHAQCEARSFADALTMANAMHAARAFALGFMIETTDGLSAESETWHSANGLPFAAAEETIAELQARRDMDDRRIQWLLDFTERWNRAQDREDAILFGRVKA